MIYLKKKIMVKINRFLYYLSKIKALPSTFPSFFRGFKIIRPIGSGSFGTVFLAEKNRKQYAIKIIHERKHALKEIRNLKFVRKFLPNHRNVVRFVTSFFYSGAYYIVMEYVDGVSLFDHLKPQSGHLDEAIFLPIFLQMLNAICAIHACGIAHLDIKFENFVIEQSTGRVVLIDLGSCSRTGVELDDCVGTPLYMDSLVVQNIGNITHYYMDIWSIGMNLVYMYNGKVPFSFPKNLKKKDVIPYIMIFMANLTKPPIPTKLQEDKTKFGKFICDISTRCLQLDPTLRPTAAEIFELVKTYSNQ
jgi:serine/threonine protein kinase